MLLIIAEKPSVGRDIAKALGVGKKGDGYIFNDKYYITWAVGHLVTLFDPEDYDKALKKWDRKSLPILPPELKIKPSKQTKQQLDIIKQLVDKEEVEGLICATDSGREGELIFRHIYHYTKCKKPFSRLWISSMTNEAILDGFSRLKPSSEYDNLYYSAKCRQEADWLVGINATRAYTIKYNVLLSIGRVQTPTLAIIVERQREINEFVPEIYFELFANFDGYVGKWTNKSGKSKIKDIDGINKLKEKLENFDGTVSDISVEKKTTKPPLLFDLTELQRVCNQKFGLSAQQTLNIAQDLYEKHKLITYPRTDSRYLSKDMKKTVEDTMKKINIQPFDKYINKIIGKPLKFTKRIIDDAKVTDHHAIIPTGKISGIQNLNTNDKKVFYTIVKQFISAFFDDYVYNVTKITTLINDEKFLTKGNTIVELGFKELFFDDDKEDEDLLPKVEVGDNIKVMSLEEKEKQTKPPKPYNEATLLSAMENAGRFVEDEVTEHLKERGIGTPATRASIIERLIQVKYIERKGKTLVPTDKAVKLIQACPDELKSPATTEKWERGLSKISNGEMEPERFMGSIQRYVNFLINDANNNHSGIYFEPEEVKGSKKKAPKGLGTCPKCKSGTVLENTKGYYCSNWKNGCKFTVWKSIAKEYIAEVSPDIIKSTLEKGEYTISSENGSVKLILNKETGFVSTVRIQNDNNTEPSAKVNENKEPKTKKTPEQNTTEVSSDVNMNSFISANDDFESLAQSYIETEVDNDLYNV